MWWNSAVCKVDCEYHAREYCKRLEEKFEPAHETFK